MRVFLKVFTIVIFVLSLSIIANPQPGESASGVEYGLAMQGTGIIVSVNNKGVSAFTQYTMKFVMSTNVFIDEVLGQAFYTGEMTLTNPATGQITDSTMITGSQDLNSSKIIITTKTSSGLLSGTFQADGSLPLVYQDFSKGTTGNFILSPAAPTP
jgi:hypothetical protein